MQRISEIRRIKAAVRERDGHRCVRCGITNEQYIARRGRSLDVHRKVAGSEYDLDHCETMCQECHNQLPKIRDDKERQRLIEAAGLKPLGIQPILLGVAQEDYDILRAAADIQRIPLTRFLLRAGLAAARRILGAKRYAEAEARQ